MSYWEHDDAIRSMIRRGRILQVDDSGPQQLVDLKLFAGDQPKKIFRPQDFGATSNPPVDSEGYVVALGGRSDRLLYLDGGHPDHRPTGLQPGEKAIFDAFGKVIKLLQNELHIDAGGQPVVITNASTVTIEATTDCAIGIKDARYVRIRGSRVDLGVTSPTGVAPQRVMTEAGPSDHVWAVV